MSDIYVFGPNEAENDYSSMGLVGALVASECRFREVGNSDSIITLKHPIDEFGRYTALKDGNIIVVPVPVRTTPEIQNGKVVTTVWTYKVKPLNQLTSKNQRTLYKKQTGSGKKKVMAAGDIVTVVQRFEDTSTRWKVKSKYGTGWVDPNGFELITEHVISDNSGSIEEVQSPWSFTDQYFRIMEVQKTMTEIAVTARHISYDLLYNVTKYSSTTEVNLQTALNGVLNNCYDEHDFRAFTNVANTHAGLFYRGRNPINAFLEPEDGVCKKFDVSLIRDNYDLYFLHDPGINRGVRIQYAKNMTGVNFTTSNDSVATRIVPVGENKNGDPLDFKDPVTGLPYVDSENIDAYPVIHVHYLKCDNCKVGDKDSNGGTITAAIAQQRMRDQALKLLQNGCDKPKISMSVEFVNLGDTEEYSAFKNLENCFLFDYVIVQHPYLDIDVTAQIMEFEWDCLLDRMVSVQIGSVGYTMANAGITTWQIPNGFSGSKIAGGTVGSGALQSDIISARHVQAESVNTSALVAGSVTTEKVAANAIKADNIDAAAVTAEKLHGETVSGKVAEFIAAEMNKIHAGIIETDVLYAAFSHIIYLAVESIKSHNIEADRLAASLAEFVSMYASVGEFDFATIQNLVAKALSLEQGSMDTVYIKNLAVTSANLLSATLGKLVLKSDDGKYYRVFVGADGEIRTEEVELTEEEIADGKTEGGKQIVETVMNVGSLNAQNIQASSAIINEILTIALTAEKITAADAMIASATIPALYTATIRAIGDSLDLSANVSIRQMVSGRSKIFYQEDMPEEYDPGDAWIVPSTGKTYHAVGLPGGSATEIVVNDDFEFMFRYPPEAEGLDFLIDQYGDLLANTEYIQLDEDGTLFAFRAWVEVPVSELHTSYIDIMQDIIRIRSGGNIEIGAGGAFNVDAGSAHFKTSDFALSILAEDGSEDTVLDFDAEGKTLRADEVKAGNIRDFFPGTTTVTAAEIGGLDGLAGMLAAAQYEHVVYTQTASDASSEVIEFNACDSMLVEIEGFAGCIVPPLAFNRLTGRMLLTNLSWNCPDQTALYADSGNVMLRRCTADAQTGVHATGSANVVWIGDDEAMTAGGACTTAFLADEGADVKLFGLIPSGERTKTLAGTITEINVRTGAGVEVDQPDKTVTIKATLGYYGTNSGWNGGAMYQGYTSGKGRIYGCMQFDLPDDIAQIKAATLTLRRVSGAGSGSNINVTVYESATEFKSRPSLGDQVAHRDKAAGTGESCTLDVTDGAKALLDGTAKQLVLYTGESAAASGVVYSRHYGKFDSAKLKITY